MSVRFGVSPIAWINDDMPELGRGTPLEQVLEDSRQLGFEGIELGGRFPRDPAELAPLLAAYSLDLIGGWYSTSLLTRDTAAEIAALQPHLALLEAMGSTVFIAAECSNAIHGDRSIPLGETPVMENWARFGERITGLADYIAGRGMRFAYHHHLGTVVEGPSDIAAFLEHTGDTVGLVVDTGHAALAEVDVAALIRMHPQRVAHVHCKDVRSEVFGRIRDTGGSFLDGVVEGMFTAPGDGNIDFGAVMRALSDIGYSGWLVVEAEQDPARADPRTYSELGLATLRRETAATGLRTVQPAE